LLFRLLHSIISFWKQNQKFIMFTGINVLLYTEQCKFCLWCILNIYIVLFIKNILNLFNLVIISSKITSDWTKQPTLKNYFISYLNEPYFQSWTCIVFSPGSRPIICSTFCCCFIFLQYFYCNSVKNSFTFHKKTFI